MSFIFLHLDAAFNVYQINGFPHKSINGELKSYIDEEDTGIIHKIFFLLLKFFV